MAIFQENPGKTVPARTSPFWIFIGAKDDGGGGTTEAIRRAKL